MLHFILSENEELFESLEIEFFNIPKEANELSDSWAKQFVDMFSLFAGSSS